MEILTRVMFMKDEDIVRMLKEYDKGIRVPEICRKFDICESTFYRIKKKFEGMGLESVTYAKARDRNWNLLQKKLKTQELEIKALKAVLRKKF